MYLRTNKVSDWKQINYRNVDSMLSVQFIYDLYDQYSSTINWFRFKNVCLYYQNNKLWSYTPADEWENVLNNIAKQFINPKQNSNPDIIKKCYWYYNRKESLLEKFLKKHSNTNLSKLTDSELYNLLFNWYQITINQIYFINLAAVELGLQRAISKLNENKYLNPDEVSILYSLDNNTAVIKEEYAFLKKVYNNKTQNKDELIEEHVKEFGYVTIGYGSKPLDKKLLYARYDKIINMDRKCVENRIKEIENYPKFIKNQKAKVYNKLNNDQLAQLFDLAAKLGYMRDRKKAYLGKSVEYRNILFEEISKRKEINIEDIKYYIMEDFSNLLINGMALSNEEIDERKKGVYISNVTNMYSGEYARENYFSSVKTDKEDINILNVRKGVCASPGVVRGKARVCLSFEESNNLKTGEILVTYGTDFDFMNAIVKSAGIITEEGGILSHASVISRELKKPCIIAFKGITKVIKTGDLIELNAENGEVKLISNDDNAGENNNIVGFYKLDDKISAKEIGNKAFNLSELYNLNCNVPEAYFLGVSFFENILKCQDKYEEYIKYSDNLEKYKNDIYNLIDNIDIPKDILTKLDFEKNTYAVRSSSPNEDGKAKSFAGQYVTELFCNSEEFTIKSIKKCWKSLLGVGLESYQGDDINTKFGGIVLQRMIPADFAGVMFTKNPVSNNKDCIIIEACKGVASKLVDNKVVPDRYFINQDNLEITASTKTLNNIPEEIIKKLASIGKDLEQKYGCDVDIEWACENNIIYIIQCRPITT